MYMKTCVVAKTGTNSLNETQLLKHEKMQLETRHTTIESIRKGRWFSF